MPCPNAVKVAMMNGMRIGVPFFIFLLGLFAFEILIPQAYALNDDFIPIGDERGRSGDKYIFDVPREHNAENKEVVLVEKPSDLIKPSLHEIIFNPTLSNEFFFEYQQRFGWTEQEQNYYLTSRQGYYRNQTGQLTATTEDVERKRFAEYMLRRLAEYHVDNYLKTEPSMRRVYQIKQTISNVKVQVGSHFKCDVSYNYSGNNAQARCENPILNTLVKIQMDPSQFLPTNPNEITFGIERPLSQSIFAESYYTDYEGSLKGIITKNFSPNLSANIMGVTYLKDQRIITAATPGSTTGDLTRATGQKENLFILGAKLIF